ncbi:Epidermal growth factor receptor substrate 15-like 1 [Toxocara canis]|uniref:Epidermal growth factor receptor substrate 15-like 1 n=1 Tax=Toxocara canis TaxID=6265 RepID=A0A0B2VYE4_TOXCA|nr:Epidermal growth factor receptor substrate 15-like 1 [Toxocara canis]
MFTVHYLRLQTFSFRVRSNNFIMSSPADISGPHTYIYENLYKEMNFRGKDTTPAQEAAAFLKRSNLNVNTLGQIWELADYNRRGCLDKLGAFIAFKLVAACQQGHSPTQAALTLNLDPPSFASRSATPSIPNFGNLSISADTWAITPTDQAKYDSIFDGLEPVDGKVSGDKVRPVLMNSGLSGTSLAKIWELSDIDKDGKLDRIEMSIALHLVYCTLQGEPIPAVLPPSLMHPSKIQLQQHKFSMGGMTLPSKQQWGTQRARTASMASLDNSGMHSTVKSEGARSQSVQPGSASTPTFPLVSVPTLTSSAAWPVQSVMYEAQFRKADTNMDGLVSGADVKEDLIASSLPQTTLARLWGLVDINKSGMLNLEQFALIMYLVDECKKGKPVPLTLPSNLVPPSLRSPEHTASTTAAVHNSIPSMQEPLSSGNEELDALQQEVQKLIAERREADQAIVQLEADMTVKNSEIKNLQIELTTLENTVAQLERQKAEAERRLQALDHQIAQLESAGVQLKGKLQEEEARLNALRTENARSKENAAKENEELAKAEEQLRVLQEQQRELDATLSQRNAMIESAAIELTKIELTTLENTVAQLERQKAEAERRLQALDHQIAQLESAGVQLKGKLQEEEARLNALRTENARSKENAAKENEELAKAEEQLRVLQEQQRELDATLSQRNAMIESAAIELTKLESEVASVEDRTKRVEADNEKLRKVTERLNHLLETSDIETIMREQADLLCSWSVPLSTTEPAHGSSSNAAPFTAVDPFAGVQHQVGDPFGGGDPFASSSSASFAAFGEPFGTTASDPFANATAGLSSGTSSGASKPPPPRPAPPKARQTPTSTVTEPADPFAQSDPFASTTSSSGSQFANFANFDAFAS